MRIFATKWFVRFARRERISDRRLREAIARAEHGAIDVDLGSSLFKQRVAREGGGRSGGYRALIAYHSARRSVFLYGFAKNERDNVGPTEFAGLKVLARRFLSLSEADIEKALRMNELRELIDDATQAKS